jgi:hypothetical protein
MTNLTIVPGLTFNATISGLTIPADWEKAYWTLKRSVRYADPLSLVQLVVSNPSDDADGVVYLNGSVSLPFGITCASGELSVNQAGGSVTVYLADDLTILLPDQTLIGWDVKFIDASGNSVGQRGTADVSLTETQTV